MKNSHRYSRLRFGLLALDLRHSLIAGSFNRAILLALIILAGLCCWQICPSALWPTHAQSLPANAKATCTVTTGGAPPFATWFESGTVTANGVVNPANSVTFPDSPNCSFYQWSWQMFLWLTSPAPPTYGGGGGRIFDSPAFYDVSPPDANGNRTLIAHQPGRIRSLLLRASKVGRHGLPLVRARDGRLFEIERPQLGPTGRQLILNKAGRQIEIVRAVMGPNKRPIFFDKAGKTIARPRPVIRKELLRRKDLRRPLIAQRFMIDRVAILLDLFGNVVEVEQGQAGGDGVLEAQYGSLVYYAIHVNDVYAYFLTGIKDGAIPSPGGNFGNAQFPTTQTALNTITAFASAHGKTFPDPNALAVEVKTSWVEVDGLPNASDYITMQASIPTYDKSNPNLWTPTGQKTAQLALVGMHVVGSTKGHPEMIWASFEHFGNTPNGTYSYINNSNVTQTINQSTAGPWLFSATNSGGPFNQVHMDFASAPNIESVAPFTISASDTLRSKAFGGAFDFAPNPIAQDPITHAATTAASNTEVIAINNDVLGQLLSGDIRSHYFMLGATWTIFGAAPTGSFKGGGGGGNEVGTSKLANSTMETYFQGSNNLWATGSNCFTCHGTNKTQVSHIFCDPNFPNCSRGIQPLF